MRLAKPIGPVMRDEDMVRDLLASKRISPNNRLVLLDYEKQLRAGFLPNRDRNFIRALYAWHEGRDDSGSAEAAGDTVLHDAAAVSTVQALKTRLAEAQRRITALEGQVEADHKRMALMEDALRKLRGETANGRGSDRNQFRHAKRSFARLFHPDHLHGSELERQIRADMFKEFWVELEQIERGG